MPARSTSWMMPAVCCLAIAAADAAPSRELSLATVNGVQRLDDYATASEAARTTAAMLLVAVEPRGRRREPPRPRGGAGAIRLERHTVGLLPARPRHGWNVRSQRRGGAAAEVCAESWAHQDLLDSCVDCVANWRQSSGHWRAVSGGHAAYGYDIRRGSNSIWYATGIFRE